MMEQLEGIFLIVYGIVGVLTIIIGILLIDYYKHRIEIIKLQKEVSKIDLALAIKLRNKVIK